MAFDDEESDGEEINRQLKTVDVLPRDMMLLKMENESIMALARTKPRDQADIMRQLAKIVEAYPAAADEAIYCKPVGQTVECQCADCKHRYECAPKDRDKATCPRCESSRTDYKNAVQKYAENLSIRAAETIRSIYGMNRLATSTEELPDGSGKVRVSGTFIDYATGTMTSDERIVSPWYKSRYGSGGMERVPEDRFLGVVVKAEKAKLRRDLILDAVPAITKAMYRDLCEKKIAETVTEGVIDEQVLPAMSRHGLSVQQVESLVGRPRSMGWTNADFVMLKKLNASLKNGETTVADLLNRLDEGGKQAANEPAKTVTPQSAQGTVSTDDLAKPKGRKKKKPEPVGKLEDVERTDEGVSAKFKPDVPQSQFVDDHHPDGGPAADASSVASGAAGVPNTGEDLDEDYMELITGRISRSADVATLNTIEAKEIKPVSMSVPQRARLMGLLANRRKELAG